MFFQLLFKVFFICCLNAHPFDSLMDDNFNLINFNLINKYLINNNNNTTTTTTTINTSFLDKNSQIRIIK